MWLRPERALWEAHALAEVGRMLGVDYVRPALEYGCLDGVNTFAMFGGEFGIDFDDYADLVDSAGQVITNKSTDVFANFRTDILPDVARRPFAGFDVGVSWSLSHLAKAKRLDIYDRLDCVEIGSPMNYPDQSFRTIWSPNLNFNSLDDVGRILAEHRRLLAGDGRIVTMLPGIEQGHSNIWNGKEFLNKDWLKLVDPGVSNNLVRNAHSEAEWQRIFQSEGLRVSRHSRFLPGIVGTCYQLGLRAMLPPLLEMYAALLRISRDDWREVKRHWIDTVYDLTAPLCDVEWQHKLGYADLWHVYELKHDHT
jgi:hypothetical protein